MFEYFSSHAWLFWLLVSIVCLILEVSSSTFYILCFAIGALGGVVSSGLGGAFWVQVVVFALFSTLSIFCIRPLALTYLHRGEDTRESNADALIGRIGTVIEPIDATQSGYIKVDGDEWRAVSVDGTAFAKGERVKIVSRDSIVMTVTGDF